MKSGSSELASNRHLVSIIRDYLVATPYVTEKKLESEVIRNHSIAELEKILENPNYSYLFHLDSARMDNIRTKFGIHSSSTE